MQFYMLHEARLGPIPAEVTVVETYPDVTIAYRKDGRLEHVHGASVVLEGSPDAFVNWLKPFDHFWKGIGQPFEERFVVVHIPCPDEKG